MEQREGVCVCLLYKVSEGMSMCVRECVEWRVVNPCSLNLYMKAVVGNEGD